MSDQVLLVADRVWDGVGDRPVPRFRVLVRDGRVAEVGEHVTAPAGTEVVELSGHTLLPGFIDCHVHVVDESLNTAPVAEQALRAIPPLRTLLANGFTTVRDLGGSDQPINTALRDAIADEGFWAGKPAAVREKLHEHADHARATAALVAGSDVVLAFGTDAGLFPYEENWKEFPTMVRLGVEPVRALRAATSVAADLLDRPDLGRVEPGATADLVAVPGDPFEDIEVTGQVGFVMQAGAVVQHREGGVSRL
ncbi:amidohydrolase family protein [Actinosynnema sp. NPDC023794]